MNGYKCCRMVMSLLAALACMGRVAVAGEVATLVDAEGPLPSVVASEHAHDREAAADLCNYLGRVTGRPLSLSDSPAETGAVIHVGVDEFVRQHAPEVAQLFADGYLVKSVMEGNRLHVILAGAQRPAATWAVEQFLRDFCQVRYLFPDPQYGEVVPLLPAITIAHDYSKTYEPDYISRYMTMPYITPNGSYVRGRGKFYGYGDHALQFLFSEPEFKAHPEWFAFFNGKRQWWSYGNGWQICTTHPGTVEHAVKYARDYLTKNPEIPVVSIGFNDGYGWCECPECTKFVNSFNPPYTLSDRWFHWANQVAREVGKTHPGKWVETMAYASVSEPPRFPLEPNIAITKTIVVPEELAQAEQWTKVSKSVNLYSYTYGNSFLGFRHYPHAAKDFLVWGREKLGARAHITECDGDWTFDGPKYHYINELQWDVSTDVDALMDDFCRSSYGPAAAEPMRAFWDQLEEIYERRPKRERLAFYVWVGWQQASNVEPDHEMKHYTRQDVAKLDECIESAMKLALAEGDDGARFRLERLNEAWRFFRASVVSYLDFRDKPLPPRITSDQQLAKAVEQARQIAALRVEREQMFTAMLQHPHINRRIALPAYWSFFTGMTLFNRELTSLDELARRISEYEGRGGRSAAAFWQSIASDDPLAETAQGQLALLDSSAADSDVLADGGFEQGNGDTWEAEGGTLAVADNVARSGSRSARIDGSDETSLLRRFSVTPGERYVLAAWARPADQMPPLPVPVDSIVEFHGKDQRIWHTHPTRNTPYGVQKGWLRVQSAFDIPPGADTAVIKLRRKYPGSMYWDDLSLRRVRVGRVNGANEGETAAPSTGSNPDAPDPRDLAIPGVTDK